LGLRARVEAKPGKEAEVESFLRSALSIVEEEPETLEWFAIKLGPSTFGIFDVFKDEAGKAGASQRAGGGRFNGQRIDSSGKGTGNREVRGVGSETVQKVKYLSF
jgi:hypothetical protein